MMHPHCNYMHGCACFLLPLMLVLGGNVLQVVLYRLSWDCIWSIDMGDSPVSALSWRPDGKSENGN